MSDETHTDSSIEKLSFSPSSENFSSFEHIQNDDSLNQSDSQFNNNQSNDDHQTTTELFNGLNLQDQSNHNETVDNSNGEQQQQVDDSNHQEQSIDNNSEQPSNNDQSFTGEKSFRIDEKEDEEETKPQRELDDNEIPPAELPVDQTPSTDSTTTTTTPSTNSEVGITDDRPLTQLEDPFGNHQEHAEPFPSTESSPDQFNNNSPQEHEINEEHPLENPTLSLFLPDVVNSTTEENFNSPKVHEEALLNEKSPSEFTSDDFPPLPPPELPAPPMVYDKEFPPLPTANPEEILLSTSNLQTEVQTDVLGNRTLFKQTLVKGQPHTRPTRSTTVTISYTLTLVDTLTANSRLIEEIRNEKYFVSENDLIPAIDICVQLMDRGETCLIESDVRHAYGDHGCEDKHIPPVTSLNPYKMKIELELHDWTAPLDIQLLSVEERLSWSQKKKDNGNFYYRRQDYKTSLQCYKGAARFVDLNLSPLKSSSDQSQTNILIEKYILIQNNIAQVYLFLNKYEECLNAVENVLKFDSKNVKALFRQGKALYELGKYQETIQPLKIFLQLQKGNSNATVDIEKANEMINVAEKKLASYQKSEKEIYQRMFRPSTPNNPQQTKNNNPKQTVNSNTNWLPYVALGAAALAVVGYVAFNKFKKPA